MKKRFRKLLATLGMAFCLASVSTVSSLAYTPFGPDGKPTDDWKKRDRDLKLEDKGKKPIHAVSGEQSAEKWHGSFYIENEDEGEIVGFSGAYVIEKVNITFNMPVDFILNLGNNKLEAVTSIGCGRATACDFEGYNATVDSTNRNVVHCYRKSFGKIKASLN